MPYLKLLLSILFLSLSIQCFANQYFRWVDEKGNTFIQSSIPPEFVSSGYEVIDEKGNVIRKVAPEPSEHERLMIQQQKLDAQAQAAHDKELLKYYRSPKDVDRAMKTWMNRLEMELNLLHNRIAIKNTEFDALQVEAAKQERSGKAVSTHILSQMHQIRQQIQVYKEQIEAVLVRQAKSIATFEIDRKRMVELWEESNNQIWQDSTD